jgi:hypothetical protein
MSLVKTVCRRCVAALKLTGETPTISREDGPKMRMADAADLAEIRHTLRQIINVKGD